MGNKITRRRPVVDERFTRPQGLYPHRDVDQRRLRRLIVEAKLAPCFPGAEESATDLEECPICFLHYPSLNRSKCCTKGICTECFLQMKSPHVARPTQCPFCKTPNYDVEYRGAKSLEEKGMEQAEEQKVIEAKIRMRNQEQQDDEERKQRREENIRIRIQQPPRVQPTSNHQILSAPIDEIDGVNWRSGWGSADRQSPALTTSAPLERIDPFSLWVDEDYQRADAAAPSQQIAASAVSNSSPINHQIDIGFPSPQAPPGATRMRYREDAFDIDLEDIMVMEAIWLSIREQEARHRPSEGEATRSRPSELLTEVNLGAEADDDTAIASPLPPSGLEGEPWDQRIGVAAGGLAGAIAALAEWQAVGGDTTAQSSSSPHAELSNLNHEALNNNNNDNTSNSNNDNNDPNNNESQPSVSGRGELDAEHSSRASEKLANWVNSTQKEYRGSSTWLGDQSSEQVEVGTSFSSSVPSASELPWEAPDNGESSGGAHNDKVLVPESFEQQMILAITLSLADAQTKVVHGGNRSGPLLPQPAHNEASPRQRQGNSRSGPLPRPTYIGL